MKWPVWIWLALAVANVAALGDHVAHGEPWSNDLTLALVDLYVALLLNRLAVEKAKYARLLKSLGLGGTR